MKRKVFTGIVSVMLAAVMSFSIFASAANELAFMKNPLLSYESSSTCTMKLNKPLLFLDDLQKELDKAPTSSYAFFSPDFKLLSESMFNAKLDSVTKFSVSPDLKKAEIYASMNFNLPAEIYKNLKLTTDAKYSLWLSYDLTDAANPQFSVIYDFPIGRKYLSLSLDDILALSDEESKAFTIEKLAELGESLNSEYLENVTGKITDLLYENASISKKITSVTVTLDNKGFAGMVRGIADIYIDMLKKMPDETTEKIIPSLEESFEAVASFIEYAGILGKDGITMKYSMGVGGALQSEEFLIDVDFNLYDFAAKLLPEALIPAWLTPENSDISFDIIGHEDYSNVNGNVTVDYPVLNEENSVNLVTFMSAATPPVPDDNPSPFDSYYFYNAENAIYNVEDRSIAIGLREMLVNVFGEDNTEITYDNGHITVNIIEGRYFKTLECDIGKTVATKDGKTFEFITAPFVKDGVTYISCDFINSAFGIDGCASAAIYWDTYNAYKQSVNVSIDTWQPQYIYDFDDTDAVEAVG